MGASEIISLLGGIALFLFGMAIMGDGLKKSPEASWSWCCIS